MNRQFLQQAISIYINTESRHAKNALKALATGRKIPAGTKGRANTYWWRQAKRHLNKVTRAREALDNLN